MIQVYNQLNLEKKKKKKLCSQPTISKLGLLQILLERHAKYLQAMILSEIVNATKLTVSQIFQLFLGMCDLSEYCKAFHPLEQKSRIINSKLVD